ASIATCVHPALSSHSASANNPCVVVGKRRTSRSTLRLLIRRRQATTSTLCTSRPAHRLCNVFIATSLGRGRREALAHRILPTVFQDAHHILTRFIHPGAHGRMQTHSITSSARASTIGGIVRPSARAVLRLIVSSYFEACSTGRSAG